MSSVTVLCPNARRQQVKVEPNLKILQIIEEVCKKQGLNSDDYEIIFQKRRLDVTLTFRLSGIPMNAQLELKKLDVPRRVSDVIIVLQLEDGSRLPQQTFKPSTNLFDLVNAFKTVPDSLLLALEASISDLNSYHAICSYLNEEIMGEFQLKNTTLKDLGLTGGRAIVRFNYRVVDEEKFTKISEEFKVKLNKKLELEEKFKQKQQEVVVEPEIQQVKIIEPEKPKQEAAASIETTNKPKKAKNEPMEIEESQCSAFSEKPKINNEFANFKFPEDTKGMVLNDLNELAEIEALSKKACPREELIYNIEEIMKKTDEAVSQQDLPEDFYDLTVNDLRYMLDDLQRKKNSEQPLMTKMMRELENDKKAMKYEKVVIRIKFQNKFILQGLFRPKEQVQELYKFVESCIESSEETSGFYLYVTPPKVILNDKKQNLFDANLCPASIIHFGNKNGIMPEFKNTVKRGMIGEADEVARSNVHQRIRNINNEGIEWLQKEEELKKNLLNKAASSLTTPRINDTQRTSTNSGQTTNVDDLTRKKFEKFLKGSKK